MLMIRLQRVGRKNDPSFRVVVTDSRNSTKSGKLKAERIQYWLSKGAKTSDTVHNLLVKKGIFSGSTIDVSKKPKTPAESVAAPVSAA